MVSVAPVRVQEDPFAVMEVCRQVLEGVLRRSAAEGMFIPRGWIDVTYGEEEMALLEEEVLPVLARPLQQVDEFDKRLRRHRRLIQAEACGVAGLGAVGKGALLFAEAPRGRKGLAGFRERAGGLAAWHGSRIRRGRALGGARNNSRGQPQGLDVEIPVSEKL